MIIPRYLLSCFSVVLFCFSRQFSAEAADANNGKERVADEPVLILEKGADCWRLDEYISYYEDKDAGLTVEEVSSSQSDIFKHADYWLLPAFEKDSACWLRFKVDKNTISSDIPLVLEINWPCLQDVELFYRNEDGTGWIKKTIQRGNQHPLIFLLPPSFNHADWFYLRLTGDLTVSLPLSIMTVGKYQAGHSYMMFLYGICYGVLFLLLAVNVYMFFTTGLSHHIWYALYIVFSAIYYLSDAYSINHIIYAGDSVWLSFVTIQCLPLLLAACSMFARNFLKTYENSKFCDRMLCVYAVVSAGVFAASFFVPDSIRYLLYNISATFAPFVFIAAGVVSYRKGFKPARFFIAAWIALCCGMLIRGLVFLDLVPFSRITFHSIQIANTFEALLLFCAIADQVRLIHRHNAILNEEVRKSDTLNSIGRLAAGIAHDFNNQLTTIIGFAQLAEMTGKMSDDIKDSLKRILLASKRARELVSKLLTFARQEPAPAESVLDVHSIIEEVTDLLGHGLSSKIELSIKLEAKESLIEGNLSELQNAVFNIFINARDAMYPKGGKLAVETFNKDLAAADLPFNDNIDVPGKYIITAIHDSGPGMTPDVIKKIYEPFFTTKGSGEGSGIGLSVVHGTMESHNGGVWCESIVGQGTSFYLTLPCSEKVPETELEKNVSAGKLLNIFIVDDDLDVCDVCEALLIKLGHKVTVCTNSENAVEVYKKTSLPFDVILLDIHMPWPDGPEVFSRLRKVDSEVKVVGISGRYPDTVSKECLDLGFKQFIAKPILLEDLSEKINKAVK
ncbi:MAG: 7TM diverse intracellular signaling domain-containing protein [Planctomycetota bacterium]|jgi:signal transduction histidine kinase/CheY-like chemotaxis protein